MEDPLPDMAEAQPVDEREVEESTVSMMPANQPPPPTPMEGIAIRIPTVEHRHQMTDNINVINQMYEEKFMRFSTNSRNSSSKGGVKGWGGDGGKK